MSRCNIFRSIYLFMAITLAMVSAALASAPFGFAGPKDEALMKLSEIKTGMRGIGRTVVSGYDIEEFDVEVLGILKNSKLDEALQISGSSVLVRVSGEVILKSGGIAAGMSGSPVYIDGKLAGAISSGWIMTDHTIGLMTPIEEMMGLFKYIDNKKADIDVNGLIDRDAMLFIEKSAVVGDYRGVIRALGTEDESLLKFAAGEGLMVFYNAASPVMVTGLNDRNYARLKALMNKKGHGIELMNSQPNLKDESGEFKASSLEPGHAIALQLVRGDINITAIGTLTYLKDNKFLAFAHSFMKKGDCGFFFAPANIYYCFFSHEMPFKIGAPAAPCGSVLVDRNEGIAGLMGTAPRVASVHVAVKDLDNATFKEFSAQIVKDRTMFTELLQAVLTQAVDEGINRQGEGFASVKYRMNGRSERSGEFIIERKNYYYDLYDIASVSIDEMLNVSNAIALNQFEKADIYDIDVKFEICRQSPCAKVSCASINSDRFEPGASVEVSVTVEGDYKRPFTETFSVAVPVNLKEGEYNLKISNADYLLSSMPADGSELSPKSSDSLELTAAKSAVSFKDLVRLFNSAERNNQIKIEFEPAARQAEETDNSASSSSKEVKTGEIKKYRETPSLDINGYMQQRPGEGKNGDGEPREKSKGASKGGAGKKNASGAAKVFAQYPAGLKMLSASGDRIMEMISGVKSQYYANNPEPAEENYKFYKSYEYIFYPFSAQFTVNIGHNSAEAGCDENSGENQKKDDMKSENEF